MKNVSKKWTLVMSLAMIMMIGFAFTSISGDWDVPAEYASMENPEEATDKSIDNGEELYKLHCKSCHGKYGEGDGPKADGLESFPGDFTSDEFQDQTDGEMFYKTKFGMDEMPEYTKKIPDDSDIWDLVNFMRTL